MDYNANIPAKYSDQNPKPSSNELLNQEKQLLGGKILMFVIFIAVITTLAISFCRIYAICLYRRTQRNPASSRRRRSTGETSSDPSPISIISDGLKPDILNSIPTFVFSAKNYENGMECSVCLSKFVDNERGRSLPNCKHYFHLDCIDMWFRSHDTCPLCRTTVNLTELTNLEMVSSQFSSPSSSKASSSNLSKDSWCIRVDNEGSEINNDSKSTPPV